MKDGWYRWDGADLVLNLKIQPRAARDGFTGLLDDACKIKITAPPVDGKANNHLIAFLARAFGVTKSRVRIETGETGQRKRVRISSPRNLPAELQDIR